MALFNQTPSTPHHGRGWDGRCFLTPGSTRDKIIIVFSGSDGGLEHAVKCCRYLYDNGVDCFALGYFRTKHSAKSLNLIPVEIIGEVIALLKGMGYARIGLEGVSKGAELALAAAIAYPEISCVILKTPSWFYSEGLIGGQPSGESCWSYKGKPLPFTPYRERHFNTLGMICKAKEYNILPLNTGKAVTPESVIPVEQIHAPILMFSTKVDTIWPSTESCVKLCARLMDSAFPYRHIAFEHMSHMMLEYCGKAIAWFIKSERENPAACEAERNAMGEECLRWIRDVWA